MATSLIGPLLVDRALAAAPVPRPPQPIRASLIVLSSPACTCGTATPASAETAATRPVSLRNARRDVPPFGSVMEELLRRVDQGFGRARRASRPGGRHGPVGRMS